MKQVTFNRAMAPHGIGDKRLVPDDVAARLHSEGIIGEVIDWPEKPVVPAEVNPALRSRRNMRPRDRDLLSQTYLTR